ncbi:MAG: sugar ABC transporter permease, partial [Spirochaetia bacterium]|nr:sugar ABC transporter permease [Spirochaetia bacterium]
MKTKTLSSKRSDSLFSLVLDLPAFFLLAGFIVVPIIDSVVKSFQAYGVKNIITKKPGVWNDFANYLYLFKTDDFTGAT